MLPRQRQEAIAANDYKNGIAQINKAIKVNKQLDEAYQQRMIYESKENTTKPDDYIKLINTPTTNQKRD